MGLKRKRQLNLPQLLWGGMSENWLLKELGHIHWQQITKALETPSGEIRDKEGNRLYASFVRLMWEGTNLSKFNENEYLNFDSELSYYKDKMFFSETTGSGVSGQFKATLLSVFSTKNTTDNTDLKIGGMGQNLMEKGIKSHNNLPPFAKEYLITKSSSQLVVDLDKPVLFRTNYIVDPYEDINGVGLLYFANYSKISDRLERHFIQDNYILVEDWQQIAGIVSRDIYYYGNANAGDELIYELTKIKEEKGLLHLDCSLYRAADRQLIGRIYSVKELKNGKMPPLKKDRIKLNEDTLSLIHISEPTRPY